MIRWISTKDGKMDEPPASEAEIDKCDSPRTERVLRRRTRLHREARSLSPAERRQRAAAILADGLLALISPHLSGSSCDHSGGEEAE